MDHDKRYKRVRQWQRFLQCLLSPRMFALCCWCVRERSRKRERSKKREREKERASERERERASERERENARARERDRERVPPAVPPLCVGRYFTYVLGWSEGIIARLFALVYRRVCQYLSFARAPTLPPSPALALLPPSMPLCTLSSPLPLSLSPSLPLSLSSSLPLSRPTSHQ